ncbi:MAG: tetraacyldisaccharide 4'-kinase [Candidatus Omnitrophica bacterium]|nr:tetraacyldisaccharide 4'-kinase [Candidatus Omnitrophota bacterium]
MRIDSFVYNLATDKYTGSIANLIKVFLYILSLIYELIVRILILLYRVRPYKLNCKVISIGNITMGGTGKTTLVEFVARYLKQKGHKVAILSRGYKRKDAGRPAYRQAERTQDASCETMGDEPYMLFKNLGDVPVLVDANRIRAAKLAIKDYSVDTVILDDGFQQWKIKKDLDILAIDAANPFGNKHLIPRGILREPLSSLKRSDVFILTKTDLNPDTQDIEDFLIQIKPSAAVIESIHRPLGFYNIDKPSELLSTDILKDKAVALISGIADPVSFENLIMNLGVKIGLSLRFADHHYYTQRDLENITKESQGKNIDTIITTEKDAVRLKQLQAASCKLQVMVLRIELKITKNEERFLNRLLKLYSV